MTDEAGARAVGCVLGLFLLLLLPVGYFTYAGYAPHLLFNPTTRYLYQFRELKRPNEVDLIPDVFQRGESKASAGNKMAGANIERWSKRYGDDSNHEVFRLRAGGNIACGYELFIEVDYDDQDRVMSATAHQGGACL